MAITDMINPNFLIRIRLVAYGVLIFFSFFIFIGVAVMKDDFVGSCPLYISIQTSLSGTVSNCNYPMAIAIMFQLLYLLFRITTLALVILGKLNTEMFLFSDILELVYTGLDLLVFFLTFIGACILSAGTNSTCSDLAYLCDNGRFNDWLSSSRAAQAGSWISTFVWLFVGICGFLCLWREGKLPFVSQRGSGGNASAGTAPGTTGSPTEEGPPIDTPPSNPDMYNKY